jgi:hypothetical protein
MTVATLVARNAKEAVMWSGGVCVWPESGVRLSVLCSCVWQESGFNHREGVFIFNLLYKDFYTLYTFSAISKDNAVYNKLYCSSTQSSISVNFDGSYAQLVFKYLGELRSSND